MLGTNPLFKKNTMKISVTRKGLHRNYLHKKYFSDIYHLVLASSWFEFFLINVTLYIIINLFFACFYYIGGDNIINADPGSFWDAFVFSFQTSSTIGYGHLLPGNHYSDIVVVFDTISGMIFVAIVTGLTFAKFAKPTAKVIFSKNCVINNFRGKKTLMFQIVNTRDSHIINASIKAAVVCMDELESEGEPFMEKIFGLKLVRSESPVFLMNWTPMHIIDSESPLAKMTSEELKKKKARILVSLTGIDDWSSQMIHANHIFSYQNIVYDKKFVNIIDRKPDGSIIMNCHKLHDLESGLTY